MRSVLRQVVLLERIASQVEQLLVLEIRPVDVFQSLRTSASDDGMKSVLRIVACS